MKRMGSVSFMLTSAASVAVTLAHGVDPTPPIGTPSTLSGKGNSTRLRALVAGGNKSERYGERWGEK